MYVIKKYISGRSARSRREPNFFGFTWPSYLMPSTLVNAKVKKPVKRMRSNTYFGPRTYSTKHFHGIKSLKEYVEEQKLKEDSDDGNSGEVLREKCTCEYICALN